MEEITWAGAAALRLRRQHLDAPAPPGAMLDVVRDLVAVQAQVMSSAELAIATRTSGATREDVATALWHDRTLVKTWAMRGTLHLVAARELPELVAGLSTRRNWLKDQWLRYFGVTREQMLELQDGIGRILSDEPVTRQELAATLASLLGDPAFGEKVTSSWGTFLKPAAARGLLCFGPDRGRNVTFVRPAEWLGTAMPGDEAATPDAVARVLERHLRAFPVATRGELARWWGVPPGELRPAFAALGERIAEVRIDGLRAFVMADDLDDLAATGPATGLRLLGGFDPYTLSLQKEAEPLLPLARRSLVSREAGWISAVLLDGGAVAGTWTHELKPGRTRIDLVPWRRLAKPERAALEAEAHRIGAILAPGVPVELAVADPA